MVDFPLYNTNNEVVLVRTYMSGDRLSTENLSAADLKLLEVLIRIEWLGKVPSYYNNIEAAAIDAGIEHGYRPLHRQLKRLIELGEIFTYGYGSGTTYRGCAERRRQYGLTENPLVPTRAHLLDRIDARDCWKGVSPQDLHVAVFRVMFRLHRRGITHPSLDDIRAALEPSPPKGRTQRALQRLHRSHLVTGEWQKYDWKGRELFTLVGPFSLTEQAKFGFPQLLEPEPAD